MPKQKDRLDGTDRWTSKGYGIRVKMTAKEKEEAARLNREFDRENAKKAKKAPAKKR